MFLDTDEKRVLIDLEDEDGNTQTYELVDLVEYLKDTFGIFLPAGQDEGDVAILQLVGEDEEKAESYAPVEDDRLEQIAFDLFQAKNMDRFDFGESSFSLEEGLL